MQEQTLTEFTQELNIRLAQADIINSVEVPYSERFWLADGKLGIWFLPCLAVAGHFWFLCFLDWFYGLGWWLGVHISDPTTFHATLVATLGFVVLAPCILTGLIAFCSDAKGWFFERRDYIKQLEKAIDKANSLWDTHHGVRYTTVREYNDAILSQAKLAMGLEVPTIDELLSNRPVLPHNPQIITLEMIGVKQEECRGASCLMPKY